MKKDKYFLYTKALLYKDGDSFSIRYLRHQFFSLDEEAYAYQIIEIYSLKLFYIGYIKSLYENL